MNNKDDLFKEITQLICSNFEDEKNALLTNNNFDAFHKDLSQIIRSLLYKDYNRLINILYRMDVNEKKYIQLFKDLPSDKIAEALADLIIERALQKAETRKKYKND
jgi:hypothetical protein